ncbi:MAG TPA: two-component regulator propeller domain-containing protein [Acidobacteriaceae bacterium]|jgi:signal transduction histidine kinase/ligand-binding sensor domain-containing protein|nr:two-component regulator propeller domain-containing protein [Acidobacteriaceae bacterium]
MTLAHDRQSRKSRLVRIAGQFCVAPAAVIYLAALLSLTSAAQTVGSAPLADQYIRTDFTVDDGLPDNVVNAVVQTANGLLWVGTGGGLASFDGREFTRVDLSTAGSMPQGAVRALLESSDGDLWVGTDAGIVLIPKMALDRFNPKLLTFYQIGPESNEVYELAQTHRGGIWAGTSHGLYKFEGGRFVQVIALDGVYRISEALNGSLLLIGGDEFLEWDGHRVIHHPGLAASLGIRDSDIYQVFQDPSGTMWYGTDFGLVRRGARVLPPLEPSSFAKASIFRIRQDRTGQMWVTSRVGLLRVDGDRLESPAPGLGARAFYVGRDGELWLGTNGSGLVHLRRRLFRMYTTADGLPTNNVMALLLTHDKKLWIGSNCGFSSFNGYSFKDYREKDGLLNTCVWALAEDHNHDLWIGTYGGGAFRMHDGQFVQYSKKQGLADRIVVQILAAQDGTMWFATPEGLSHLEHGHFRNYTVADGLSSNQVLSIHQDRGGNLWVATRTGLDRFVDGHFQTFPRARAASGHFPTSLFEDSLGNLYAAESLSGIGRIEGDQLIDANDDLNVLDVIEAPQHDLWFASKNGIVRIRRDNLMHSVQNRDEPLDYQIFDRSDGLASTQCSDGMPNIALTPDGKLWVATVKGLAMVELTQVPLATRPPKVFVGGITVGNRKQSAGDELTLPAGTHHFELSLEAVDLASPEKVRIQYRLDGVDPFWLDAGPSRTAVYSNLPPGTHNFHVRACASSGVWDRTGIIYKVTQQPYFYQTTWFLLVTTAIALLLLSGIYLLRLRHVLRLAQMRMDERMVERERIAQDLHDTLLQGVLMASMQLDLAEDRISEESAAKPLVQRVLQMLRKLTEEGRIALRGLRTQDSASGDLAIALLRVHQEVPADEKVGFSVIAPNVPCILRQTIRDEVYRIGREALLNAFHHAKAKSIEVEIEYSPSILRLVVRDDGEGIDPRVLQSGREGHWGLQGMQERAERIGAHLRLRSRLGAGTEFELTVPAAVAFENVGRRRLSRWPFWPRRPPPGKTTYTREP